jgi:hypothetical protein
MNLRTERRVALVLLLAFTLLTGLDQVGWCQSQQPATPAAQSSAPDISIGLSPQVVQPVNGKLPSSVNLAVFEKDCEKVNQDLSAYSIQIAGIGLSLSSPKAGKCVITATLAIDPNTPAATSKVILLDGGGHPSGSADFAILDSTAGPIPSGLVPQVDVMWEVLSQSVCNDVFGKRVARNFYCIEVKIGNETGHSLQIAGIGFSNHIDKLPVPTIIQANTSYASTRAVLLRETVLSPRNIFYHSVQATGLLMSAFAPYFIAAGPSKHFATAASIVSGPALAAINIIGPDRVVGQLNNLDDESFRDNQIIPNNSHVRTIVFIEKRALTEIIEGMSGNASVLQAAQGSGNVPSSKGSKDKVSSEGQSQQGDQSQNSAQTDATFKANLTTEIKSTAKNSQQKDNNPIFFLHHGDHSPLLVKLALGNLVIVGDEIEYLQRVQVQSGTSSSTASVTVNPSKLTFGDQDLKTASSAQTVTVTNTGAAALTGFSAAITGTNQGDFAKSDDKCGTSVAAGASCTMSVTFTPTDQGARAATLNIVYTGSGSPQTVSLAGNGANSTVTLTSTSLTFSAQSTGTTSSAQSVTLTNSGSAALTSFSASKVSGANSGDFTETDKCGASVAASASCTISVTFKPGAAGSSSATLNITYSSNGSQQTKTVSLTGTGK